MSIFTSDEYPAKRLKRVRIGDSVILALGGRRGKDVKLIIKAIEDREHLTIKITKDQIDIHSTDEKTGVHTPRSKISLADRMRTRQLLGLLRPLSKITDAVAIHVPNVGFDDSIRRRLEVHGRKVKVRRMTPDEWERAYRELYTEIPLSAFPAVTARWGLLIGRGPAIIGYAFKTSSGPLGVLKSDLEALD